MTSLDPAGELEYLLGELFTFLLMTTFLFGKYFGESYHTEVHFAANRSKFGRKIVLYRLQDRNPL